VPGCSLDRSPDRFNHSGCGNLEDRIKCYRSKSYSHNHSPNRIDGKINIHVQKNIQVKMTISRISAHIRLNQSLMKTLTIKLNHFT